MADKTVKIAIQTVADTTGAKQVTTALDSVQTEAAKLDKKADSAATGIKKLGKETDDSSKRMGKMGNLANQASYQLGDFFTQVEMGTGMVRAFSQQAPQMLGALSSAGMLSSTAALSFAGIGAAIPLIAIALPKLVDAFSVGEIAAEKMHEAIISGAKRAADSIVDLNTAAVEESDRLIDQATQDAITLGTIHNKARDAESKAALASADNAEKIRLAQTKVAEALGLQIDRHRELEAIAAHAAGKREGSAAQAITAETDQLAAASKSAYGKTMVQGDLEAKRKARERELEIAKEELAVLRQSEAYFEKMRNRATGSIWGSAERTDEDTANSQLEILKGQLAAQENLVGSAEKELKKATIKAEANQAAFSDAMREVDDVNQAVATNIQTIQSNLAADNTVAEAQAVVDTSATLAAGIQEVVGKIQVNTAQAEATQSGLTQLASDSKIIGDESDKAVRGLAALMGSLQNGSATTNGNIQELINLVASLQQTSRAHADQIKRLSATKPR